MATLTKSTGTVTLSGAAEKVTLPAAYGWVWLKNMSDADMFAGLSADISEGADGVMVIPAGECGRIQTDGFDFVYLLGAGSVMVVAQNYADCPFKTGGKGGDTPDLSAYAKKTDIPTELPANGGNADTVNGHTVNADVPADAVFTDTKYDAATADSDGLMSAADKVKLDSVNTDLQFSVVDGILTVTYDDGGNA